MHRTARSPERQLALREYENDDMWPNTCVAGFHREIEDMHRKFFDLEVSYAAGKIFFSSILAYDNV